MEDNHLTIIIDRIDNLDGSKRSASTNKKYLRRVSASLLLVDPVIQGGQDLFPCQTMLEG